MSHKNRPQAKSVKTLNAEDVSFVAKKVEHFSMLAKAYSNGPDNFSSRPSYQGVRSLLSAARDNLSNYKSIFTHYQSNKALPINKQNNEALIKIPNIRVNANNAPPLSQREPQVN